MPPEDKVNILVVDDLPDKLLALQTVLEELGENVVTAPSGREALRRLLDQDFAVVLLDVNMPGMDGFETAALIRQRRRSEHTPIIFVTAYHDETHISQGYSLGAVDYILAPVVPEILRAKISVFVDLFRKNEQVKRQAEERVALAREQVARAAAEEATRRSTFLSEASAVLTQSLNYEATVDGLVRLVVPFLADFSAITMTPEDRAWHTRAAWIDPDHSGRVQTAVVHQGLHTSLIRGIERVLATGKSEVLPDLGGAVDAETHPCLPLSLAVVYPLLARGRTLGALSLAMGPSGRHYAPRDLVLTEELVTRAAIAIDNARLYQEIQARDRRKSEFLAMLAHELRNPLAPIRNALQLMRHPGADPRHQQWSRDVIDRQVQQLTRLVDDLLDVSRITRGKINLQFEVLNVGTVVARAIETSRPLIDARQHGLTATMPDESLFVHGDGVRLAQVLANLLNNAAKYTEEGGQIWLTVESDGSDVLLRVRDTGIGLSPDLLPRIFDLFTQADKSLDRAQGGLGIGLTLARSLVELHGGKLTARSDGLGKGSEFCLRLPLSDATTLAPAVDSPTDGSATMISRRVLVVDDSVDSAESLGMVLKASGHEVQTAYDGPTALEVARGFRPGVILLDIGLPGMNGYEVARELRSDPGLKDALLVAVTGYGREEDRRSSREAGFDEHLVKPVDSRTLLALLSGGSNL